MRGYDKLIKVSADYSPVRLMCVYPKIIGVNTRAYYNVRHIVQKIRSLIYFSGGKGWQCGQRGHTVISRAVRPPVSVIHVSLADWQDCDLSASEVLLWQITNRALYWRTENMIEHVLPCAAQVNRTN